MELNHLTPAALSELIRIAEEKQTLLAQIEKIDASMEALITNNAVGAIAAAKPAKLPRKVTAKPAAKATPASAPVETSTVAPQTPAPARAKRGALKEGILAALASVGNEGLSVGELSTRLGAEPANIHVWFSTTGKKLAEITKVAAGRYALASVGATPEKTPANEVTETVAEPAIVEIIVPEATVEVVEIIESEPEIPAASLPPEPAFEPEPAVIEPTVEETIIVESVIELEPEAAATEPTETDETSTPEKHEDFLLSSN